MKMKLKLFATIIVLTFLNKNISGQIAIGNLDLVPKDKTTITYFMLKDPSAESAKPYIKALEEAWTIGKLEFIKYSDKNKYTSSENYFISIGGITYTTTWSKSGAPSNMDYSNTHVYLEYYKAGKSTEKVDKKGRKSIVEGEHKQIARIELYTDFQTLMEPSNIFNSDIDGAGHIRNWGPGILKNYVQCIMSFINNNVERKLYDNIDKSKELKNLRNATLFVPDNVLIKFGKFSGDESKRFDESDVFKKYTYKYQLLSIEELNEKILTEKNPFYYLVYIKSSTDKFVSVINSVTGEMLYTRYKPVSYNFKSDDIEEVQSAIKKN